MLQERTKTNGASRLLAAGAFAVALAGMAAAMSVSSAEAQTHYPPADVAGSISERVQAIYGRQVAPTPGYYGSYAMRGDARDYRSAEGSAQ